MAWRLAFVARLAEGDAPGEAGERESGGGGRAVGGAPLRRFGGAQRLVHISSDSVIVPHGFGHGFSGQGFAWSPGRPKQAKSGGCGAGAIHGPAKPELLLGLGQSRPEHPEKRSRLARHALIRKRPSHLGKQSVCVIAERGHRRRDRGERTLQKIDSEISSLGDGACKAIFRPHLSARALGRGKQGQGFVPRHAWPGPP